MIVVDASIVITALGDNARDGQRVRQRLAGEDLAAPELMDLEAVSAFRRLTLRGELSEQRAGQALDDLAELRVQLVSHRPLLSRCWQLRDTLTVYDAAYVALAELLAVPLLTADRHLANAPGPRCSIELFA